MRAALAVTVCSRPGSAAAPNEVVRVPPTPVDVVNGIGAIVASRLECSTAMPTTAEVEALLAVVDHG